MWQRYEYNKNDQLIFVWLYIGKENKRRKQAKKISDKKQTKKTLENMQKIRKFLIKNGPSKTSDIAEYLDLSAPRIRAILKDMPDIEFSGTNTDRKYFLNRNN